MNEIPPPWSKLDGAAARCGCRLDGTLDAARVVETIVWMAASELRCVNVEFPFRRRVGPYAQRARQNDPTDPVTSQGYT
ncbi:MAG: hypothetical protein ACREJM_05320, partial [Candidatus Saccharimonadales bacterium]